MWLPVDKSWRLNERHYGALEGLKKAELAEQLGAEQVRLWRRAYDVRPPALEEGDKRFPGRDRRYACLTDAEVPRTENLNDTFDRVMPYWSEVLSPLFRSGRCVLANRGADHAGAPSIGFDIVLRRSRSQTATRRRVSPFASAGKPLCGKS